MEIISCEIAWLIDKINDFYSVWLVRNNRDPTVSWHISWIRHQTSCTRQTDTSQKISYSWDLGSFLESVFEWSFFCNGGKIPRSHFPVAKWPSAGDREDVREGGLFKPSARTCWIFNEFVHPLLRENSRGAQNQGRWGLQDWKDFQNSFPCNEDLLQKTGKQISCLNADQPCSECLEWGHIHLLSKCQLPMVKTATVFLSESVSPEYQCRAKGHPWDVQHPWRFWTLTDFHERKVVDFMPRSSGFKKTRLSWADKSRRQLGRCED